MPRYDSDHFEPPAPVARVTLRGSPRSDAVTDVPMLLDTGADVSMVPRAAAVELALGDSEERFKLVGFDGSSSQAAAVELELVFSGRSFQGKFLLIEQEWGILGRNVLNRIPILYDGPHLVWAAQGAGTPEDRDLR